MCPQCRLLQPEGQDCIECGGDIVWTATSAELLAYRPDQKGVHWGSVFNGLTVAGAAATATTGYFMPILSLIGFGSLTAVSALGMWRFRRHARTIAPAPMPSLDPGTAPTFHGTARRLTTTVAALADGRQVLAEHLAICNRKGALLLRHLRAAPFLVDLPEGEVIVVSGNLRVSPDGPAEPIAATDPRLASLDLPDGLLNDAAVRTATIREGNAVAITGTVEEAVLPELATYREAGGVRAMHGRGTAVVFVARA